MGNFPEPLRIADDWEDQFIVRPTLAERADVAVRRLDRLIHEMAANWESLNPEEDPRVDPAERARFVGAWHEHRQIYGYTLLSELPFALRNALHDHPDVEGVDYDLLIVDEYQDLNACDLEVLRLIADRGCSIIGAGDDDQSIYSFRRAAPAGIRRFPDDYPNAASYALSLTQRCGNRIMEWATYVIEGDPDRPHGRPRLQSAPGSPAGEAALLAFQGEAAEAAGICSLARNLIEREGVEPEEILILLRGDYNHTFSNPIKQGLDRLRIRYSDPGIVERILGETSNRRMLEVLRLLVDRRDSLAWASLLRLTPGIGDSFFDYIYERARVARIQFGQALLNAYRENFAGGPRGSSTRAQELIHTVSAWLDGHAVPEETPEDGWGAWIVATAGGDIAPTATDELQDLLLALDDLIETDQGLGRYLGQIYPLGKDRALAESQGVRIMTMGGAKGLTVRVTIIAGLEEGIIPRPDSDLAEERRLLYVGMTRAKHYLYGTWARRRRGPTARAGAPRIAIARRHSHFLDGGPITSEDGNTYLNRRWPGR